MNCWRALFRALHLVLILQNLLVLGTEHCTVPEPCNPAPALLGGSQRRAVGDQSFSVRPSVPHDAVLGSVSEHRVQTQKRVLVLRGTQLGRDELQLALDNVTGTETVELWGQHKRNSQGDCLEVNGDGITMLGVLDSELHGPVRLGKANQHGGGSIGSLQIMRLENDLQMARKQAVTCLEHAGGSWTLEDCKLIVSGGVVALSHRKGHLRLQRCILQGSGPGVERAGQGLSCAGSSSVQLQECRLVHCLTAMVATGNSTLSVYATSIAEVSYGLGLDDRAEVQIHDCDFCAIRQGAFLAGSTAWNASLSIRNSNVIGKLWFGVDRPGRLKQESNQVVEPPVRHSHLQESKNRTEYNFRPADYLQREGERPGSTFDFPTHFA